jgi:RND family efflux transporter MFP subunit
VTVTQIDPIAVSFTLPEKELPGLQLALAAGTVQVSAVAQPGEEPFQGKVSFVDNSVDAASGTIRVKAEFGNPKLRLWPGMYVTVEMSPRVMQNATVVPAQAVQTGPETRFVFLVGDDRKVSQRTVGLAYIEEGFAVVSGLQAGARVVVEGAQNLRPGSSVAEAERGTPDGKGERKKGEGRKGEGKKGEGKGEAK